MADVNPDVFKVLQGYAGLKAAYIEVASMDSADVIKFVSADKVATIEYLDLIEENDSTGRLPLSFAVAGTSVNELTLKTAAKTGIKVSGIIYYVG